ncbi:MAG: pyruvate, phosphate dikinase [Ilumatobacteraceae bacterium]|nr:pyruvate, phosphate dikinase [Ilumatobacteraceae bacterium]
MTFVYAFDHRHRKPPMSLKGLLGGKGANLAEMTSVLKLPVPPGFTVSTDACREYLAGGWPERLDEEIARHVFRLEKAMGRKLGDPYDPLLVSVRSGAKFSMPGMMDTVLNLGLNDVSVGGLADATGNPRFAYDSYRRFIMMYAKVVLGVEGEEFESLLQAAKNRAGVMLDAELDVGALEALCKRYLKLVERATGSPFPQSPRDQLRGAVEAVFSSWNGARAVAYRRREHLADDLGTAVNVQAMVFGNRDDGSGTGVGFTRNAATGENRAYGDFLVNAQGEDVVAGIRNTESLDDMRRKFPEIHRELLGIFVTLEAHYRDMCDTEFTIEQGKLWMLQTRVGKRTGAAALKMAVDMTKGTRDGKGGRWKITRAEAVGRITEDHLEAVLHPQFRDKGAAVTSGVGASPGAAVGRAYFTAQDAVDARERGEDVILVRQETTPDDIAGMMAANGILTARGGLVSHAAVVARGWGTPAVVGAEAIDIDGAGFRVGTTMVAEGDWLSIDGDSGDVALGQLALAPAEPPPEFTTVLAWADRIRKGRLGVRANADTAADAATARELGAEGIGLCRTEHMFLAPDRLPIVRSMILASNERQEAKAFERLRAAQQADFETILTEMDGLPVTVRLLDPPLHEFLPSTEELRVKQAGKGKLSKQDRQLLEAAEHWSEHNPMLGTRGVRLAVIKPGLYAMQVRALLDAVAALRAAGKTPIVEIMIPLTVSRPELELARGWVRAELDKSDVPANARVTIGTMIETPRAALRAAEMAEAADFFSFGTNDLTQLTFGFSRDDVESRLMPAYLLQGLLRRNPFDSVDADGVGELVRLGVERGRTTRPDLKIGVCGEHGGDPDSIGVFARAGVDYVSCSPFRVPVARLAAAQAVLSMD